MSALTHPSQPKINGLTKPDLRPAQASVRIRVHRWLGRLSRSPLFFVLLGIVCVGTAVLVRFALDRWVSEDAPLLPFVMAVLVAAWYGGLRPGLFTTVLAAGVGVHLFIEPSIRSWVHDVVKPLWFVVFLGIGATVSWLCESLHVARRRAEAVSITVLAQQMKLEDEIEARRLSDDRFRRAVEESPFPIMLHAEDGEVLSINRAWADLTGYTLEHCRTVTEWAELVLESDRGRMYGEVARVYDIEHREAHGEYRFRTMDGQERVWDMSSAPLGRLPDGRRFIITMSKDVTLRRKAEDELRTLTAAVEAAVNGIVITDREGVILWVNPTFTKLTGYDKAEAVGRKPSLLKSGKHSQEFYRDLWQTIRSGSVWRGRITNRRKDGALYEEEMTITPVRNPEGAVTHFIAVKESVQEKKLLEEQLHQSQKMEAIGRLAGGVAHDFNNLLTIISGYSEILLTLLPANDPNRGSVKAISEAGERAAGLTRQLLSFSRQAVLEPRVLDLNGVVKDAEKMLRRMIGEDVLFTVVLDPQVRPVKVDPGRIGQVLMNLAVNARDAMPEGGRLTIETAGVDLDREYVEKHVGCKPGSYVRLTMTDTGSGMTEEVKARIFEPFFTTKDVGKGTGLGLSVVQGIVEQSGGFITVYSEPGVGTAFKIHLPVVNETPAATKGDIDPASIPRGTETVLVVEDEESVREIARLALRSHGYTVLAAASGKEALRAAERHAGRIDLLLTDVVMPEMNGRQLAEAMASRFPLMRVLFMSGYTDDAVVRHGILQAEVAFIHKPYTPVALLRKVRQVLDEKT